MSANPGVHTGNFSGGGRGCNLEKKVTLISRGRAEKGNRSLCGGGRSRKRGEETKPAPARGHIGGSRVGVEQGDFFGDMVEPASRKKRHARKEYRREEQTVKVGIGGACWRPDRGFHG